MIVPQDFFCTRFPVSKKRVDKLATESLPVKNEYGGELVGLRIIWWFFGSDVELGASSARSLFKPCKTVISLGMVGYCLVPMSCEYFMFYGKTPGECIESSGKVRFNTSLLRARPVVRSLPVYSTVSYLYHTSSCM